MSSVYWSKGKDDRHGVGATSPKRRHVLADILSVVLTKRGSRGESFVVEKHDFVPMKVLLKLTASSCPPSKAATDKPSLKKGISAAAILAFGSEFKIAKNKNGYYRMSTGKR